MRSSKGRYTLQIRSLILDHAFRSGGPNERLVGQAFVSAIQRFAPAAGWSGPASREADRKTCPTIPAGALSSPSPSANLVGGSAARAAGPSSKGHLRPPLGRGRPRFDTSPSAMRGKSARSIVHGASLPSGGCHLARAFGLVLAHAGGGLCSLLSSPRSVSPALSCVVVAAEAGLFAWLTLRFIPNNCVGVVEKLWSAKGSVPEGASWPSMARPAFRPTCCAAASTSAFGGGNIACTRCPLVTVPQGKIGYVYARDGQPLPPSQTLGSVVDCNNFQDARASSPGSWRPTGNECRTEVRAPPASAAGSVSILREGVYAINLGVVRRDHRGCGLSPCGDCVAPASSKLDQCLAGGAERQSTASARSSSAAARGDAIRCIPKTASRRSTASAS